MLRPAHPKDSKRQVFTAQPRPPYGRSRVPGQSIRVNAISPGSTGFRGFVSVLEQSDEQFKTNFVSTVPMGRLGNPDEIAKAVSFLASDDSSFVTGIELFVDGGAAQI